MVCSDFWELDKIDKIGISLILILFCLFSVFECFCFAETPVSYSIINNLSVHTSYDGLLRLGDHPGAKGLCYNLIPGHKYVVHTSRDDLRALYTTELPKDQLVVYDFINPVIDGFEFIAKEDYIYFFSYSLNLNGEILGDLSDYITLYDVTQSGFVGVINSLYNNVGLSNIWYSFETSLPFVLVVVLFAFGFMIIFNIIKGLSKGKGRI